MKGGRKVLLPMVNQGYSQRFILLGKHLMDRSRLQIGDSSIEVHHQGAHLCSWVFQGEERLFVSRKSLFEPAKAIRGGVPICFPQFGAFGPGQQHGFARNVLWQKCESTQPNVLRFQLSHNNDSLMLWPHEFKAQFNLSLESNSLSMCLSVENVGTKAMAFTAALHTYLRVNAIENAVVEGLDSCEFWDNGNALTQRKHQDQHELRVDKRVDRVYFNTVKPLSLIEPNSTRLIESQGFADTVIWNPWRAGACRLVDMADDEYQQMLCIESANVQTPTCLQAGETWHGVQTMSVVGV